MTNCNRNYCSADCIGLQETADCTWLALPAPSKSLASWEKKTLEWLLIGLTNWFLKMASRSSRTNKCYDDIFLHLLGCKWTWKNYEALLTYNLLSVVAKVARYLRRNFIRSTNTISRLKPTSSKVGFLIFCLRDGVKVEKSLKCNNYYPFFFLLWPHPLCDHLWFS